MRKASFLAPTLEFLMKRHRPETLGARGALVSGALPWRMDARRREHLKRELAQAERHLAEGKGHIDRQVMILPSSSATAMTRRLRRSSSLPWNRPSSRTKATGNTS